MNFQIFSPIEKIFSVFFIISFLKSVFFQNFDLQPLITFLNFKISPNFKMKFDIRTILNNLYDSDF